MTTDQLISYFKTPKKVAEFFNISQEAFYQWQNRPKKLIPKDRAIEAAFRTNSELAFDENLYQNKGNYHCNNHKNER
ncbi:Cro/CI family transcriptional regulator [uncultured Gilliamella sp.]|uniref:Cro/CI family transcriptional regulator n=1 Tax=uncultured Gilliamella sp. TaxID=1193505 RepID=UPI0025ECCEF1|nr:Cro/CI family transcriptional regulator [uncultured Gilliamella sp.]